MSQGFESGAIIRQVDKKPKSISGDAFMSIVTISEFDAESARKHQNPVGMSGFQPSGVSVCFLKSSKSIGKRYTSSPENFVWVSTWSSWIVQRYHGTVTVSPDFQSDQRNVTARNGNTTDRVLDGSTEVEACFPVLDTYDLYPHRCNLNFPKEKYKAYKSMDCYPGSSYRPIACVYSQIECSYWHNGMMMRGGELRVNPSSKDTYSLKEESTTVFLYEYLITNIYVERSRSCTSVLSDEDLSLLERRNYNEQFENISEGKSFRVVWVKTDHPEGVGVVYSDPGGT